jgi:hypothetical protein
MKELEAVEKCERFRRLLAEFEREAAKGGFFDPEYLVEKSAHSMLDEPDEREDRRGTNGRSNEGRRRIIPLGSRG